MRAFGVLLSAVVLGVVSCAPRAVPRLLPEVPPGATPVEVPPDIISRAEIQQEIVRAYPPDLFARGVGGRVEVWVHIDTAGQARLGAVKASSGNDQLDCAAMQVADIMEYEHHVWICITIHAQFRGFSRRAISCSSRARASNSNSP